jgi:hypothetical protein
VGPSFKPRSVLALAVISIASLTACGGTSPSTPVAPPTTPTPPAPVQSAPPVAASACERIGDGVYNAQCKKGGPLYYDAVDAAIEKLIKNQPHLFDLTDVAGPGSVRVLEPDDYYLALGATLGEAGYCAQMDVDKAYLRVKLDNEVSEDYQVMTGKGFTARGVWIYRSSCAPAAFPVAAPDAISYIRLSFFGFECAPGAPTPERGTRQLPMSCDGHLTATPKDLNGRDVPSKIHGSDVQWRFKRGEEFVSLREWPDEPFNLTVMPRTPGFFKICASVQGLTGCLGVEVIP